MISAWRPFKAWVPVDILSKVNAGMVGVFPSKLFRSAKASRLWLRWSTRLNQRMRLSCRGCAGPLGASPENNPQIELPRRAKRTTGQFMIEDVFRGSPKGTGESNEAGRYRYSI